jgi:hypothetical protein
MLEAYDTLGTRVAKRADQKETPGVDGYPLGLQELLRQLPKSDTDRLKQDRSFKIDG